MSKNKFLPMKNLSANEIVADINIGWNLGNALDSHDGYKAFVYYQDTNDKIFSQSQNIYLTACDDGKSLSGKFSCKMDFIKSSDTSKPRILGLEILNISKLINVGVLNVDVIKADINTNGKTYQLSELLGNHLVSVLPSGAIIVKTSKFNVNLINTSNFKVGTIFIEFTFTPETMDLKPDIFETLWKNPIVTKELIDKIREVGFNAVRVPVTWCMNMDANGKVKIAWMDRIEEVVNYVLDNNMYCIINLQHDTGIENGDGSGWLKADISDNSMVTKFALLWKQIAERFKDYNEHLLFEGFSEIITKNATGYIWTSVTPIILNAVNTLNQIFVDTVRSTGDNNSYRCLIVEPYSASTLQKIIDGFVIPNDIIKDHIIVSVHDYEPQDFSLTNNSRSVWGNDSDKEAIDAIFYRIDKRFLYNKIPVIIGEFGSSNKSNTEIRNAHANYYVNAAKKKGVPCFWWDTGGVFSDNYKGHGIINRTTLELVYPEIALTLVSFKGTIDINILPVTSPIVDIISDINKIVPIININDDTLTLIENKDFQVKYISNKTTGKITAKINGIGKYYGTKEITFMMLCIMID